VSAPDVDDVAVERACDGDRTIRLEAAELTAAVDLCERRGLSAGQTGTLLGVSARTVAYVRAGGETTRPPRGDRTKPLMRPSDVTFLTVAEVARELRVSKMTIYRLVESGELQAKRVGRSIRVPGQALSKFLRDLDGAA